MKALSIRQPWAWLVVNNHKDNENRTWPTRYRGRALVHAGQGMTRNEYEEAECLARDFGVIVPPFSTLERGGIVGAVTIRDCIPSDRRSSRWHMPGQYGFALADGRPCTFIPCKGQLLFYDVDLDVDQAVRAAHGRDVTGAKR